MQCKDSVLGVKVSATNFQVDAMIAGSSTVANVGVLNVREYYHADMLVIIEVVEDSSLLYVMYPGHTWCA